MTNYLPKGYHNVIPYLLVKDGAKLIDFLEKAFNGKIIEKMTSPEGRIMHAEVKIGDSVIMMGESSEKFKTTRSSNYMYVEDTDSTYKLAIEAGATSVMEPADQFYGDRSAGVIDDQENYWWIATKIEDLTKEEVDKRAAKMYQNN